MSSPAAPAKRSSQEEDDLQARLNKYDMETGAAMSARRRKWKKHYAYWVNRQIPNKRPRYKSDIRVNYLWVITQVKIPVMTQMRPTGNFIPYNTEDANFQKRADNLSKIVGNVLWNKLKLEKVLTNTTLNSCIYDIGWWKVGWDQDAENGLGDAYVRSIDPFKILPDPAASCVSDCRYIIHQEPYPVEQLKIMFPKVAAEIVTDPTISEVLHEERKTEDRTPTVAAVSGDTKFAIERAMLKEYWLGPGVCPEQEQRIEDDPESKLPQIVKYKKFPNGRVVTRIGKVIVNDKPHPFAHGKFPFIDQPMNVAPDELFGMGDLEQCIPIQDAINHCYQQIDDIRSRVANANWRVDPSVDPQTAKEIVYQLGQPGATVFAQQGQVESLSNPAVPGPLITQLRELIERIFDVSGISDVLQGSGRVTHRTARGIERLYDAAATRIGQSVRNMEGALKEVYLQLGAIAQQFYTVPRKMVVIGREGAAAETIEIGGAEDLEGQFEVSIDSGVSLPKDKQSRADLTMQLLQNKVFDLAVSPDPAQKSIAKVILDAVEYPMREALLRVTSAPMPAPAPQPAPPEMGMPVMPEAGGNGGTMQEMLQMLSPEEQQAIMAALGSTGAQPPVG